MHNLGVTPPRMGLNPDFKRLHEMVVHAICDEVPRSDTPRVQVCQYLQVDVTTGALDVMQCMLEAFRY